jgi:hypothetical protein
MREAHASCIGAVHRAVCGVSPQELTLPLLSHVDVGFVNDEPDERRPSVRDVPQSIVDDLRTTWTQLVTPATGCADYDALRAVNHDRII